jgi:pimeloyl-ACP methyl ester carboxylesterase
MVETVVLVHGYFKGPRDMRYLAGELAGAGYAVVIPKLPTTFGTLAACATRLSTALDALPLRADRQLHLVGHSMGGLIIRRCLAQRAVPGLGRCVLIATPNHGTALADLWRERRLIPRRWIPPSIECLRTDAEAIGPPRNRPLPEVGVIAGSHNNLLLGRLLLPSASDGRVPVESTRYPAPAASLVLPFGHRDIHFRRETAQQVTRFLRAGRFDGEG